MTTAIKEPQSNPDRSPAAARDQSKAIRLTVAYDEVRADPNQPRKEFPAAAMAELRESIRVNGIQEALIVRLDPEKKSNYMLVEGERRWRSAGDLKLKELPVEVREFKDDAQLRQYQRIVGTMRLNLSLLEQARDYKAELERRKKTDPKFSPEALADALGISRASMYDKLKLTRLTPPVEKALRDGEIVSAVAVELSKLPTQALQEELLENVLDDNMSVRDLAAAIRDDYLKPLTGVTFDLDVEYDAPPLKSPEDRLPTMGPLGKKLLACAACPHRTGNMLGQFPELKDRPNVCTLVKCFEAKTAIGAALVLAKAEADGSEVVSPETYNDRYYEFTKESDLCYSDKKSRSWAELAKIAGVKPMITVDSAGKVQKIFKRAALGAIQKTAGIKVSPYSNGGDRAAVNRYKKEKKEYTVIANKATQSILLKLAGPHVDAGALYNAKLWRLLARSAFDLTDISKHSFTAKRRGLAETINDARSGLQKYLAGENDPLELARFTLELMLCAAWEGGGYQKCGWDAEFKEVCAIAGGTPEKLAGAAKEQELPLDGKPASAFPKVIEKIAAKTRGKKFTMSPAGKARIMAAQKARWAKVKAAKGGAK